MNVDQLAKTMRERALLIEGDSSLANILPVEDLAVTKAKEHKLSQVEALKKLYFNAGRWVGGARDQTAREAFLAMNEREQ
jgi:hypothetical protein